MSKENKILYNDNEIQEAKSLRWLANMFPYSKSAIESDDKINNAIHIYCMAGANKIEELAKENKELKEQNKENDIGEWEFSYKENIGICSICGYEHYLGTYREYATSYCPNCGNKMKEEK